MTHTHKAFRNPVIADKPYVPPRVRLTRDGNKWVDADGVKYDAVTRLSDDAQYKITNPRRLNGA